MKNGKNKITIQLSCTCNRYSYLSHVNLFILVNHGWETFKKGRWFSREFGAALNPNNMMIFACNRTMKVELLGNLSIPEVVQTSNANCFAPIFVIYPNKLTITPTPKP